MVGRSNRAARAGQNFVQGSISPAGAPGGALAFSVKRRGSGGGGERCYNSGPVQHSVAPPRKTGAKGPEIEEDRSGDHERRASKTRGFGHPKGRAVKRGTHDGLDGLIQNTFI